MPSTVIQSFEHHPDSEELILTFVSGRRYVYTGVSADDAWRFRTAFSKGTHFNHFIRDRFDCREIEPSDG